MIISITGHRPNGLPKEYGYNLNNETWTKLKEYIEVTIEECYKYATPNEELTLVSGMALGVDTAFWEAKITKITLVRKIIKVINIIIIRNITKVRKITFVMTIIMV